MKVATIVPTPYLDHIKGDKYHMCLYQEVVSNPKYADFYRAEKQAGSFVIMDNGAAEGENPSAAQLMEAYEILMPDEAILPDVIYDSKETLRQSAMALQDFKRQGLHKKLRFMGVPQGKDFQDWVWSVESFLRMEEVQTLGVSKFVTPRYADELGGADIVRRECVDTILTLAAREQRDDIEIHLLGCWDDPAEVGLVSRAFRGKVRGTDSAIAYVYTRNGKLYRPGERRPDYNEIPFKEGDPIDPELMSRNKQLWINYCKGNLEVVK